MMTRKARRHDDHEDTKPGRGADPSTSRRPNVVSGFSRTLLFSFFLLPFSLVQLSSAQPSRFDTITTVDIVSVPVTVTNSAGRFVFGLTRDDFEIRDDGERRPLTQFSAERVPVSLGILVDISGSMTQDPKARAAEDARWKDIRRALELLVSRLDPRDEVFLAAFADKVGLAVPWTLDHPRVLRSFKTLRPGGRTGLVNAVTLIAPAFRLARYQRRALLLLSDGQDTVTITTLRTAPQGRAVMNREGRVIDDGGAAAAASRLLHHELRIKAAFNDAKNAVVSSNASLYAVGMGTRNGASVNVEALQTLTADTGGYVEPLRGASELPDAIARMCDELQAQYFLTFASTHSDGKAHAIAVTTRNRDVKVRARSSYVAPQH
jgi:VWFA-related protein